MVFLKDDMITLRAVEPEDAERMWEFETDSRQWLHNGMCAPYSRRILKEYACTYDADPMRAGQIRLVVAWRSDRDESGKEEIIGLVDLFEISPQNRTAFVGVYIKESERRKGHATRALALTEEYAHRLLNLRMIGVKICEDNFPSIGLFTKKGYERAGRLDGWLLSGDRESALLIFTKTLK